jgi:hypothetical protein
MPNDLFNTSVYGITQALGAANGTCYLTSGAAQVLVKSTDYTTENRLMVLLYNGVYYCYRTISQRTYVSDPHWEGAWIAGAGTNYEKTIDAPVFGIPTSAYAFSHAVYYTLGTVKNISIEHNSPLDVMGMPYSGDTSTLIFDTEGVITKIKVSGQFFETNAATMDANITILQSLLSGQQYVALPCVFWWDIQKLDSQPKGYFVAVENFSFTRSEKDTACVNYNLSLVRRALSV